MLVIGGLLTDYNKMAEELMEYEGVTCWKAKDLTSVDTLKMKNCPELDVRIASIEKLFNGFGFDVFYAIAAQDSGKVKCFGELNKIHKAFGKFIAGGGCKNLQELAIKVGCCTNTIYRFKIGKGTRSTRFIANVFGAMGCNVYLFAVQEEVRS